MRLRLFVLASACICALAQEPVFKVDTTVRQIDAVVTDKQGRVVTDLEARDFEILEGRKARAAEYCSYVPLTDAAPPERTKDGRLLAHQLRRTFVFVISDPRVTVDLDASRGAALRANLMTATVKGATDAIAMLEHFVRNRMQPGDLVEVLKVDQNTGVLAQLTNDRDALLAAIEKMRKDPLSLAAGRVEVRFNLRTMMGRVIAPARMDFQDLMEQNLRAIRLVSAVADSVAALPGRKAVILAARFMLSNNPRMAEGQIIARSIADVVARANKAGVTVHSVPLGSLSATATLPAADSADSMISLSGQTGGTVVSKASDAADAVDRIVALNRGYYLLGYHPSDAAAPVKVRVRRAGFEVYARTAGVAPGVLALDKPLTTENAVAEAFASPLRIEDLPVALEAGPVAPLPRKGKTRVHYELKIDLSSVQLGLQETGNQGFNLEITIGLAGPDGEFVKFDSNIHHFQIAKGDEQNFRKEMTRRYDVEVDKPGEYQIRALVRDTRSNRAGTAARFIEIVAE